MRNPHAFRPTALGVLERRIALSHIAAVVADGNDPEPAPGHVVAGNHGGHQRVGGGTVNHHKIGGNLGGGHHRHK